MYGSGYACGILAAPATSVCKVLKAVHDKYLMTKLCGDTYDPLNQDSTKLIPTQRVVLVHFVRDCTAELEKIAEKIVIICLASAFSSEDVAGTQANSPIGLCWHL